MRSQNDLETVKLFIYEQQREKRFLTEKILFEKLGLWLTTKLWLAQNLFWNENRKIMGKTIIHIWLKLQNILFSFQFHCKTLLFIQNICYICVRDILRIEECLKYSRKIDIWNWRRICIWFWYWKDENKNWALFKNGQFRKQI